ncbi:MAG: hypothetical protein IZT57_00230, partial [Chloroflexi bacterium]|nr:hypothetical protein [Chloroflexota bacterium]
MYLSFPFVYGSRRPAAKNAI